MKLFKNVLPYGFISLCAFISVLISCNFEVDVAHSFTLLCVFMMSIFLCGFEIDNNLLKEKFEMKKEIENGGIFACTIKWNDNEEEENVLISVGYDENNLPNGYVDDDIFFYCEDMNVFEELHKEDNGEDFVIIRF